LKAVYKNEPVAITTQAAIEMPTTLALLITMRCATAVVETELDDNDA